jgi:hypothetical protein
MMYALKYQAVSPTTKRMCKPVIMVSTDAHINAAQHIAENWLTGQGYTKARYLSCESFAFGNVAACNRKYGE